jgi:hypothetical protein
MKEFLLLPDEIWIKPEPDFQRSFPHFPEWKADFEVFIIYIIQLKFFKFVQ